VENAPTPARIGRSRRSPPASTARSPPSSPARRGRPWATPTPPPSGFSSHSSNTPARSPSPSRAPAGGAGAMAGRRTAPAPPSRRTGPRRAPQARWLRGGPAPPAASSARSPSGSRRCCGRCCGGRLATYKQH